MYDGVICLSKKVPHSVLISHSSSNRSNVIANFIFKLHQKWQQAMAIVFGVLSGTWATVCYDHKNWLRIKLLLVHWHYISSDNCMAFCAPKTTHKKHANDFGVAWHALIALNIVCRTLERTSLSIRGVCPYVADNEPVSLSLKVNELVAHCHGRLIAIPICVICIFTFIYKYISQGRMPAGYLILTVALRATYWLLYLYRVIDKSSFATGWIVFW